jgi:hypothetical protein
VTAAEALAVPVGDAVCEEVAELLGVALTVTGGVKVDDAVCVEEPVPVIVALAVPVCVLLEVPVCVAVVVADAVCVAADVEEAVWV